jgi:hypothetical protein
VGVVKVSLEKVRKAIPMASTQMTEAELEELESDNDDMPEESSQSYEEITEKSDAYLNEDGVLVHDVIRTRYVVRNVWHLDPIPPESLIVSQSATCVEDARLIGTRQNLRVYEAVAMGLPYDELVDAGVSFDDEIDAEKQARTPYAIEAQDESGAVNKNDPTSRVIRICEVWVQVDADGDGIAELRHIITAGTNNKIITDKPVEFCQLALFKSDIQPHVFFPISVAEDMMQDQDAQTALLRSIIDNTGMVNSPRTEINESMVNLEDAKNNEIGAMIRVKMMGQIQELVTPFVAGQTLPVLTTLNEISEARSGVTKLSQGLDQNALQSTSRIAANAAVTGSDSKLEMMARNLGETGIASMFKIILRTAIRELKGPQSVSNNGIYTPVRPDMWHDQMDVSVNVGLGNGRIDEKIAALGSVSQVQMKYVEMLGFQNPICGWNNLRNTYKLLLRLGGLKTVSDFFPPITEDQLAQLDQQRQQAQAQAAQSQQPPVPDVKGAAEIKAKADMAINNAKLQQEFALKTKENDQKGKIDIATLKVKQDGDMTRLSAETRLEMQKALMEDDRQRDEADMKYAVDAKKVMLDDETKRKVAIETNKTRTQSTEALN